MFNNTIMNNLIIFPFAYNKNLKTGSNLQNTKNVKSIYLQNIFVAALSAKLNNNDCEVALIVNIDLDNDYKNCLTSYGISIYKCDFCDFKFKNDYKWNLAFYKLCALKFCSQLSFDNILCLDADTYTQSSLSFLWGNLKNGPCFYNRFGSTIVPIGALKDLHFFRQMYSNSIERVGGEFFASTKHDLKEFIHNAETVFNIMFSDDIVVSSGDEYISSLASAMIEHANYNGERYICRVETGLLHKFVNINKLLITPVLHLYGEKKYGLIKIYKYLIKYKSLPNQKYVYNKCHIKHISIKTFILLLLIKIHVIKV